MCIGLLGAGQKGEDVVNCVKDHLKHESGPFFLVGGEELIGGTF